VNDNVLTGTLPAELGQLTALRKLLGAQNRLRGPLPDTFAAGCGLTHVIMFEQMMFHAEEWEREWEREWGRASSFAAAAAALPTTRAGLPTTGRAEYDCVAVARLREDGEGSVRDGWDRTLRCPPGGLSGALPGSLSHCRQLKHLWLDENEISGPLPGWLAALPLQQLDVFDNNITGPLPASLHLLNGTLRILKLQNNRLDCALPSGLAALTALRHLNLHHTGLRGCLPEGMAALTDLEVLQLAGNALTGAVPAGMQAGMLQLQGVDLGGNGALRGRLEHWEGMDADCGGTGVELVFNAQRRTEVSDEEDAHDEDGQGIADQEEL
jgi:hypothetical protein